MKIKTLVIAMTMMVGWSFGQNASDKLFDKYSGTEGITSIHITSYMFQLFADVEGDAEMAEFQELAGQIDRIKILSVESTEENPGLAKRFHDDISKTIPMDEYKELMIVKESDQEVLIVIKEEGKKISEVLMLVDEPESSVLISVTGDIDLNKLAKLSSTMNIDGFEQLENLEDED